MAGPTYAGILMIIVGVFEIFVTPMVLQLLWSRNPPPRPEYVLKMVRRSGAIVVVVGFLFLIGLFGGR